MLQGVVETLDRENDWLEMSEEGARVRAQFFLLFCEVFENNSLAFS